MISCDDYQNKVVAVLDNESSEQDEKLLSTHLAECPACRAFYAEAMRTRQLFSIATATKPAVTIGRQFMRTVEADAQQGQNRSGPPQTSSQTRFKMDSRRLLMAGGLAAVVLVAVSWLACYVMSREVAQLRSQLQGAQQDLAVARAEEQRKEDRVREQRAITALYVRMAELERRVERFPSRGTAFLPTELTGPSNRPGDM